MSDSRVTDSPPATAACRECGVEADACCADLGYLCCWFCTVTRVAHQVTGIHKDSTTGGAS